jgi:putative methyltransferase
MSVRRRVYLNEYNVLMENTAYLPLVSGLLRAYAETSPGLRETYEFAPFLFHRDDPQRILARYDAPAVAAFSVSMWNEQLSLRVAAAVKARWPECLVVLGGPQVPHHPADYFAAHPFVDVAVRGEGEEAFAEILERFLTTRDFGGLAGVAWRDPATGACVRNPEERPQARDLDHYPSPYLEGLFDDLMAARGALRFQAIIETNRGCPFPCTFCFWGQGGLSRKYRFHGLERVRREIEWCARNRIAYVFNADSNFGMHRRDLEIAEALVAAKRRWGYPQKFRTCFGKNTDDKIYDIAVLLHAHGLEKGITLARQSNDERVLRNVRRQNIKLSTYESLQRRFNAGDVPVYSELILGLPGETWETWTNGIEEMLRSGLRNQLFVYLAQVYPNTELADPAHQRRFGIETRRLRLTEIHGAIRPEGSVVEHEDVIVATASMPVGEWRRMAVFSWLLMVLHSLKLGFFVLAYLADRHRIRFVDLVAWLAAGRMPAATGALLRAEMAAFERQCDRLLAGHGRGHALPEFGAIYWDEEEASFLRLARDLPRFWDELHACLRAFLDERGVAHDPAELAEAIRYQAMRIPAPTPPAVTEWTFEWSFPEYFETLFREDHAPLCRARQRLRVTPTDWDGDLARWARETILWGRKSGTMLVPATWEPAPPARERVAAGGAAEAPGLA